MNKRLVANFNKACSRYIKAANTTDSVINYSNLFSMCEEFIHKATNRGAGICDCADSNKVRAPNGKNYVMHTCGSGFFDALNNSGWTQVGPGWGGGIFDTLKSAFSTANKMYEAHKGLINLGVDSIKRKAGSLKGYLPEKMVKNVGEGFGGAWGPYSQVHSTDDIKNWAMEGLETASKIAESV